MGGCSILQNDHHCTVSARTQISVNVLKIQGSSKVKMMVNMYNHTHCFCDCKKSPDACDPTKEVWNNVWCSCECRSDLSACASYQRWNKHTCECRCARSPYSCSPRKTLNYRNCECSCREFFRRICKNRNDLLDPSTCRCISRSDLSTLRT